MNAERLTIYPGALRGVLAAPPSKSMMQRVLAALLVRPGSVDIHNPGTSADERVVIEVLRDAGFYLVEGKVLRIEPPIFQQQVRHVNFGESGLAARMLTPILALQDVVIRMEGSGSLRTRPMRFFQEVLPKLGVRVASNRGYLPATLHGPLRPANVVLNASDTSQALSGLLMAYAGAGASDVTISVQGLTSRPYIDLTLQVMELMGLPVPENRDYQAFYFPRIPVAGSAKSSITIEGDWSGAAFLLVAGAIAGTLTVTGLDAFSRQGDKNILVALMECEAQLTIESRQVRIASSRLKAFQFDANDCPDLFPPLAVLACYAKGTSVIKGVNRLRHKESDRATTITSELGKMGADISLQDDLMIIRGATLHGADTSSHNDHRIAMMCAIAALGAQEATTISSPNTVDKSYPRFFEDLETLGARIEAAG